MRKILTTISIVFLTYVSATTLTTDKSTYGTTDTIKINFSEMDNHNKDWIGIYPKGSSTAWKNVVKWAWTENKSEGTVTFKNLPAGDYEVRGFYNNSYHAEAIKAFKVEKNQREFGIQGVYLNQVKSVKTLKNEKVTEAIYYVNGVDNLPTIIFMSGWKVNIESYDGFLTYLASLGYCVIAKIERGKPFNPSIYTKELTTQLTTVKNKYNADITKLGIIGHSSGGGVVHYLMNYFKSNKIAGTTKSVVMSLDGWFPFGTTEAMLKAFDTPTLLMQFGGNDGLNVKGIHPKDGNYAGKPYGHYQDPKITLAIFKALKKESVDKEYVVIEANNNHSYFQGNYASLLPKRDFLAPIDEFLNHTLGTGTSINLINQSDDVITNDLVSEYQFYCNVAGFDFCKLDNLVFP